MNGRAMSSYGQHMKTFLCSYPFFVVTFLLLNSIILLTYYQSSISDEENLTNFNDSPIKLENKKPTAVIYAHPTYHDEIASVSACLLHELGYPVVAYVGNGVHIGGFKLPFSDRRIISSKSLYGPCVDKWISIHPMVEFVKPDVLLFATYPMTVNGGGRDIIAYKYLKFLQQYNLSCKVLFITHKSEDFWQSSPLVEKYIPRERTKYIFLGEHTLNTAKKLLTDHFKGDIATINSFSLSHIIPTMPLRYIVGEKEAGLLSSTPPEQSTFFAIQGNFGGRHSHRKDPKRAVSCVRDIESSFEQQILAIAAQSSSRAPARSGSNLRSTDKPQSLLSSKSDNNSNINIAMKDGENHEYSGYSRRVPKLFPHMNMDMIGSLHSAVNVGELHHAKVRFLSDLNARDYYTSIAKSKFLITALNDKEYFTTKATSSVPAALIGEVPLVSNRQLLNLYPCLRDMPTIQRLSQVDECDSIYEASQLDTSEYSAARKEMADCNRQLWKDAKETISKLSQK